MIIIMSTEASQNHVDHIVERVTDLGYDAKLIDGAERTIIGVVAKQNVIDRDKIQVMKLLPGVADVQRVSHPYKLASREFHPDPTTVNINGAEFGGDKISIIAGPCSVESREQIVEVAHAVKEAGAVALRGGAFKPRTSPFSFQGLGEEGLKFLAEAREETGLGIFTEVMEPNFVEMVTEYADVLQVGARNMQNYPLLNAVGASGHPVLLKRGMSSKIDELLMAADYILNHDNPNVMLCERGIRTFETATRNTFDVNAIPLLKMRSHLPVIADPSHGTGDWQLVEAISLAAIAAGADGLIIEVHPNPPDAVSDGFQSLRPERFAELISRAKHVAEAIQRVV